MRPSARHSERGIVLVMTVLVLSIVVIVAYAFSYAGGVNAAAARHGREALEREAGAESALQYALALLRADAEESDRDALDERWADLDLVATVGGAAWKVTIVDENRKLNVNRAALPPEARVLDLSAALGRLVIGAGGTENDVNALRGWIDPHRLGGHDDMAPKRPVPFIAALRAIPDLDAALFAPAEGRVTLDELLCTHPERINLNTARREVLDALWEDATLSQMIVDRREQTPWRTGAEIEEFLRTAMAPEEARRSAAALTGVSDHFTVRVTSSDPVRPETLTALVRRIDKSVVVIYVSRVSKERLP